MYGARAILHLFSGKTTLYMFHTFRLLGQRFSGYFCLVTPFPFHATIRGKGLVLVLAFRVQLVQFVSFLSPRSSTFPACLPPPTSFCRRRAPSRRRPRIVLANHNQKPFTNVTHKHI